MNITAPERVGSTGPQALVIADRVEAFVRNIVIPYERDTRFDHHGCPTNIGREAPQNEQLPPDRPRHGLPASAICG